MFRDEHLGYVQEGMQTVIDQLEQALTKQKVVIYKNAQVLDFVDGGRIHSLTWREDNGKVHQEPFSHLVATIPPRQFLEIFNAPAPYLAQWDKIDFIGAICITLVLKESLQPYYWTSINDPDAPFVALVEHTNFVDKANFKNDHIIYLGKYLKPSTDMFLKSDAELRSIVTDFLQRVNPKFTNDWIKEMHVFRAAEAQHLVTTDYKVPQYNSGIRNVLLAHFAQIYPQDRGVNNAVKQAQELFKIIKRSN
jgi:protoporphyrinogen oxidase